MIYLQPEENYFILIDGQGAEMASGIIYESIEEVAEQFQSWAEADGQEEGFLKNWSIGDCLTYWVYELKEYQVNDFGEPSEKFINHLIIN